MRLDIVIVFERLFGRRRQYMNGAANSIDQECADASMRLQAASENLRVTMRQVADAGHAISRKP